jgi:VanZ family protein
MNRKIMMRWFVVLVWMFVIFYLSHQPAIKSSALSGSILEWVLDVFPGGIHDVWLFSYLPDAGEGTEQVFLHVLIRKFAHLMAYFILGLLVVRALYPMLQKYVMRLSLLICLMYAVSDEVHQVFVPGRSGEIRDVLIDMIGVISGIFVFLMMKKWQRS